MDAIVLTYDRNHCFTQLMIESYQEMYPNHPFTFRVPYNEEVPDWDYDNVEFVQVGVHFQDTINGLLEGIDDDEFIYWANDDRYLRKPVNQDQMDEIVAFTEAAPDWLDEIKTTSHEGRGQGDFYFNIGGVGFYNQIDYRGRGFWMHHFMRAGLLKKRFNHNLRKNYPLKAVTANLIVSESKERIIMPERAVLLFAEPLRRGMISINGITDMRKYGISVPPFENVTYRIMYDEQGKTI